MTYYFSRSKGYQNYYALGSHPLDFYLRKYHYNSTMDILKIGQRPRVHTTCNHVAVQVMLV